MSTNSIPSRVADGASAMTSPPSGRAGESSVGDTLRPPFLLWSVEAEGFGGCFPAERFAGSGVEGRRRRDRWRECLATGNYWRRVRWCSRWWRQGLCGSLGKSGVDQLGVLGHAAPWSQVNSAELLEGVSQWRLGLLRRRDQPTPPVLDRGRPSRSIVNRILRSIPIAELSSPRIRSPSHGPARLGLLLRLGVR